MSEICTLYHEDSYKFIDQLLESGVKVDHIITDPPYNISKDNNFSTMNNPRTGVDFGQWDRGGFDLYSWIPKYAKLLNKNGSMIIFCSYLYISHIADVLNSEECGMDVKDVLIWKKTNPMPRNRDRRYVQDMEFAIWAVKKRAKWVFNRPKDVPYLRSIIETPLVSGKEKLGHKTQKSLMLMEKIIKVHTNPGQLVLDPFMGSGSTGEAALLNGRRFIGIELDDKHFKMSSRRLSKYTGERIENFTTE